MSTPRQLPLPGTRIADISFVDVAIGMFVLSLLISLLVIRFVSITVALLLFLYSAIQGELSTVRLIICGVFFAVPFGISYALHWFAQGYLRHRILPVLTCVACYGIFQTHLLYTPHPQPGLFFTVFCNISFVILISALTLLLRRRGS
jgi:hypothetical protein